MRIFISHSTAKADAPGKGRLDALKAALEPAGAGAASGHEVLLDFARLESGAKWRSVLDEWMACCHSAVLMLDPVAVRSPWVLKEATILAHRAALDPAFLLFPALLDGVEREDLSAPDSPFSKLYLDAIQRVPVTDPVGIANAVKRELGKLATAPGAQAGSGSAPWPATNTHWKTPVSKARCHRHGMTRRSCRQPSSRSASRGRR